MDDKIEFGLRMSKARKVTTSFLDSVGYSSRNKASSPVVLINGLHCSSYPSGKSRLSHVFTSMNRATFSARSTYRLIQYRESATRLNMTAPTYPCSRRLARN